MVHKKAVKRHLLLLLVLFSCNPSALEPRCEGEDNGCCTPETPCKVGEGDCDTNADCVSGLCGSNNCGGRFDFDNNDDCCADPDATGMCKTMLFWSVDEIA